MAFKVGMVLPRVGCLVKCNESEAYLDTFSFAIFAS
jgi:hypothetical protein